MNTSHFFNSFFSRLRSGMRQDPVRDWLILLTLSILAFVCIVVWNMWAFDTIAQGGAIGRSATSTQPVFDRSSLDTVHSIFAKRAEEEAKYVTGVYRYADPSQ